MTPQKRWQVYRILTLLLAGIYFIFTYYSDGRIKTIDFFIAGTILIPAWLFGPPKEPRSAKAQVISMTIFFIVILLSEIYFIYISRDFWFWHNYLALALFVGLQIYAVVVIVRNLRKPKKSVNSSSLKIG